ncbi:hypothetical protein [Wohlfahrtiimonas populi]|uniref:hypothetical protein n=1 Tax=Wohlfahrtiimonas populi TaxID=1940240 RepID=UPI00098D30F4|nr:hypothetical protein [Wohlfahrtiimonas populi]
MKKSLALASLLSSFAFATGPSMVDARIQPLSINDQSELLYKYILTENPTGAHTAHPLISGLGVFKDGKYIALTQDILDLTTANSEEAYWAKRQIQDKWFAQACETDDLTEGFTACNVKANRKDQWLTLAEYKEQYGTDLLKVPHMTLHPSDIYASSQDKVYVDYEFKPFVVLQFKTESCFDDGFASLVIANTIMNDQANDRNSIDPVPFDCATASAIIMK